ncbi:succinyldiaminopimelate aminotransferase [Crenobacter luteus]|uniref:Putative 8-amino-7-oxononanoate synthase n=1 Tax=Crenobacter luteus TaxID=1452487 RepID=A0A163CWA7_9NEIS|nr:succinyldiaminopimelate transaminase [Crenobacter luteus]KZE33327.1 succinyldiaminopimelate transaminase [Crenobacter luteus]TCP13579.1 succinyldiaminopimelate aminotransferase [Crenobacter luteus]
MNPHLDALQPYPFQRLRELFAGAVPNAERSPVNLSIGEPKHPAPACVKDAVSANLSGLSGYPATQGGDALRAACAAWLQRRYGVAVDAAREVLPVNGSREALFAFAQALIDASGIEKPVVISPNPFYQIYEGAALLSGAEPYYVNTLAEGRFQPDWASVPEAVWRRTQLVFVCSPGNPTGAVMSLEDWQALFALSDRYGFTIASDECYSEIYFDAAPLGGLEAAAKLGRDFTRLVMFTSLSKRSNVPGMRSGFVAGDANILAAFLRYRTYHGCAMSPLFQAASVAAWNDEAHVAENRALYAAKFAAVMPILAPVLDFAAPDAGFYLWARVPGGDDAAFARGLFEAEHVTVLPGRFLARDAHGVNPGAGYIRIALVAPLADCVEAAHRIARYAAR